MLMLENDCVSCERCCQIELENANAAPHFVGEIFTKSFNSIISHLKKTYLARKRSITSINKPFPFVSSETKWYSFGFDVN